MLKDLVSIIIPMYNSEEYIRNTIDSLIRQTYKYIEIIVIDDGSSDQSANIIKKEYDDKRLKYFYQQNSGAPAARNYGLDLSEGKYVVFFDADDVMDSNGIDTLVKNIIKNDSDIALGDYNRIDYLGNVINQVKRTYSLEYALQMSNSEERAKYCIHIDPLPSNKMFKKFFLLKHNIFFSNLKIGQDLNFYLKCLAYEPKISISEDVIFYYRVHDGSISRQSGITVLDIIECFREIETKNYSFYNNNKDDLNTIKYNNYSYQLYKIPYIKDRFNRKNIYFGLKSELDRLGRESINNNFINVNKFKVNLALKFPRLYTSNILNKFIMHCMK